MTVIGIDFGNKNICISKINKGKVEMISNLAGRKNILNMISFNNIRVYDSDAMNVITQNINSNLIDIHNLIQLETDLNSLQPLCNYENPYYQIEFMDEIYKIRKEHIILMVFNYIKKIAGEFSECVISIPSFMENYEKNIFINASKIANINILGFVNDPLAAAINYQFFNYKNDQVEKQAENEETNSENIQETQSENRENENIEETTKVTEFEKGKNYIFLNIGENHTSVSTINMQKNTLNIINQTDSKDISGKKIDFLLMEYFCNQFYQQHEIDIKKDNKTITKLKKECEKIKKILSINKHYKSNLEYFYKETDFLFSISREEFEHLIFGLSESLKILVDDCISNSKLEKENITSIELIGGGCRIPLLINSIKKINIPTKTSLNLDEAVSKGCCLLGAMISKYIQTANDIEIKYPDKELHYQIGNQGNIKSENNHQINFNTDKTEFILSIVLGKLNQEIHFNDMDKYHNLKNISVTIKEDKDLQIIQIQKVEIQMEKESHNITDNIIQSDFQKIASEIKNVEYNLSELEMIIEKKYQLQNNIEETYYFLEEKKYKYSSLIGEQNLEIINQMDQTIDELYDIDNVNTYEEIYNQLTNIKENLDYRIYEYENIDKYSEKLRKNIELCLKDIKKRKYLSTMGGYLNDILMWADQKIENKEENMNNNTFTTNIIDQKINEMKQKRKDLHIKHKNLLKEIKSKKDKKGEEVVEKEK